MPPVAKVDAEARAALLLVDAVELPPLGHDKGGEQRDEEQLEEQTHLQGL